MRGVAPDIRRCYEAGLARDANLHGRVATRFVVAADGTVDSVSIPDNSLPDCDVVACIRNQILRVQFKPPTGGPVTVVYAFVLETP